MEPRKLITSADMDTMTPQERADAVNAAVATDWSQVPEPFKSEVLSTARWLSEERRKARG